MHNQPTWQGEDSEPTPAPLTEVIALARELPGLKVKDAGLPRPEGLPWPGWYEARRAGGRVYLYWRWSESGITADALCPCGSGRRHKGCCMVVRSKSLGRLDRP